MGNENMASIGLRIAKLREDRGLSQKQLADELGKIGLKVRRETVTQWENGSRDLKTEYTVKLADFFGVSCDEILRGIKAEHLSVAKTTGLSDETIGNLRNVSKLGEGVFWHFSGQLNNFLGNRNLYALLDAWGNFRQFAALLHTAKIELCREFEENKIDYRSYHKDDNVALLTCATLHLNDRVEAVRNRSRLFMERADKMNYTKYKLEQCIRAFAEEIELEQEVHGF